MKLSIIIPVYNVGKYVEKCIRSCENQYIDKTEYEIIVINDGSSDGSFAIVEGLAKEYPNVKVFSQENAGLSAARNAGLEKAQGEYVWFVDSDDWIEENCLGRITSKLVDNLDILHLQYRNVYDDEKLSFDEPFTTINGIKSGREITLAGGLPAPAQFSIYRRFFLLYNQLSFVKGIYHEDSEFKPRAVYLANKITTDNVVSYNYYQRISGNIMSTFCIKRASDMLFVNKNLWNFSKDLDVDIKRAINLKISTNFNSLFTGYRKLKPQDRKEVVRMLQQNKQLLSCLYNCSKLKYKIEGIVFSANINFGLMFYKLLKR